MQISRVPFQRNTQRTGGISGNVSLRINDPPRNGTVVRVPNSEQGQTGNGDQ